MRVAVVIESFADYIKGQVIKVEAEIKAILEGHNAGHSVVTDHAAEDKRKASEEV